MKRALTSSRQPSPPDCLTVEEAAAILRISRTSAYARVNEYLDSDGALGIPAIRIARQIRVPRVALEDRLGGPITWPIAEAAPTTATVTPLALAEALRRPPRDSAQLSLAIES